MSNTAPIFKWASWWKSDDIFVGIPDSFQDSQNIDIRSNPRWISLNKKLTKDSSTTVVEPINCFLKASTWDVFAFWNSWWVYHKTWWVWYKNTNSITWAIVSAIEYNWYMYLCNSSKLYRVALANYGHAMTFIEFKTFTNWCAWHPFIIIENNLFVWDKSSIDSLDNLDDWIPEFLEINSSSVIRYLQAQGINVKIYFQNTLNDYCVSLWNWVDTAINETIPLNGVTVEQLINKDWFDYIISNNKLWVLDGYKTSTLKSISNYSTNLNSITVKWNRLLFWWVWWVWEWGNLNKNYAEVLSNSYNTSNAVTDVVWAIFYDWTDLYVSWSNGSTYWIDKLSTSYSATWYVTNRVYYWDTRTLRKASINVLTAFNKLSWTDTIKIYYREQITWSYTLFQTITASSTKINDYCDMLQLKWEWNFIEFKIELNSWTGSTTPEFYELFLEFDNLKK
jgi:hypothetical protein